MKTITLDANPSRITKRMIRASHEAQFNGVDYQKVAVEIAQGLPFDPTDDELGELESSPDPACDCGFCHRANWL